MEILYYFSIVILVYIYVGYPFVLLIISNLYGVKINKGFCMPMITVLISAYNEEKVIRKTIENKLIQDYPKDKYEIIVVSDGSNDRTDDIVNEFQVPNVRLIRQSPRKGKTSALNLATKLAKGKIIVFSDANSIYDKQVLARIARCFADERVGYVTGKMIYLDPDGSIIGDGCNAYMKYENKLRELETKTGSVIGVDGGIDAMRMELYEELNNDQLPDFVQPLQVLKKGYRVIYEPTALLMEDSLKDTDSEFRMRVRVTLRAIWGLYDMRALLNPFKYPFISFKIISHKLLRYLAWLPLLMLLITNLFLVDNRLFYILSFIAQIILYFIVLIGSRCNNKNNMPVFVSLPYYFFIINYASAVALMKFLQGKKMTVWTPRVG